MQLLLKDIPLLDIRENGTCTILDFDLLPFSLRKENITFIDFIEWASNRTLSIGRSFAKEILNALRLSQTNRYAVCKACRGLSLEDAYWIRQDGDKRVWDEVNLFQNPLSLYITEISLSGASVHCSGETLDRRQDIHTPELTTLGASAKGWIRKNGTLYLHKVGKYEIPADRILAALDIPHIHYRISSEEELCSYLTEERREWIESVGDAVVNAELFTSQEVSMVTFEEFQIFCGNYGLDAYEEAEKADREFYLKMQIADYILNNNDRHEQNWGFFMENATGRLTGYCPLFDHDHAFAGYSHVFSQTRREQMTLYESAAAAQKELGMDLKRVEEMERPEFLTEEQWEGVLARNRRLKDL